MTDFKPLATLIADRFESGKLDEKFVNSIASYLITEKKSHDAPALLRLVESELARRNKTQIVLTSARPLSTAVKAAIAKQLAVDNPLFHEVIDPAVIGGVRAETQTAQLDTTLASKLNHLAV